MPLVKIYVATTEPPSELRTIADGVHDALVAQANVPADDRFQILNRSNVTRSLHIRRTAA